MIIIIESKYKEKVDHLAIVFSARLWWAEAGTNVTIIPVTVGSLGCVQSNLDKGSEAESRSYTLQETAVVASGYILQRFLIR